MFFGPLIIVGGDELTGENRGLEPEEVAMFKVTARQIVSFRDGFMFLPELVIAGG